MTAGCAWPLCDPTVWAGYVPENDAAPGVLVTKPILCNGKNAPADGRYPRRRIGCTSWSWTRPAAPWERARPWHPTSTQGVAANVAAFRGKRICVRMEIRNAQVFSLGFTK